MPQDPGKKRESKLQALAEARLLLIPGAKQVVSSAPNAGEPSCQKCLKKGIECSGLGQFRFSARIARRGKLKGYTIPVAGVSPELAFEKQPLAEKPGPFNIRWKDAKTPVNQDRGKRKRLESAIVGGESSKRRRSVQDADRVHKRSEMKTHESCPVWDEGEQDNLHLYMVEMDFDEIVRCGEDQLVVQESSYRICPWVAPFSAHFTVPGVPGRRVQSFSLVQLGYSSGRFEFPVQPLLGESQGIEAPRLPPDQYLDWACYDLPPDSEYNRIVSLLRLAFMKASQLYVNRATLNQDQPALLWDLWQIVSQVGPDEPGSHALVWVCFLAAADSKDPEQREYFTDRMNRIFAKTRFENIQTAVRSLPALWERQGSGRWTEDLIRLAPTLIM